MHSRDQKGSSTRSNTAPTRTAAPGRGSDAVDHHGFPSPSKAKNHVFRKVIRSGRDKVKRPLSGSRYLIPPPHLPTGTRLFSLQGEPFGIIFAASINDYKPFRTAITLTVALHKADKKLDRTAITRCASSSLDDHKDTR
ncbi:hypothetical protein HPP92_000969 [Vanilla planifolia]|uniref:Uncharacterized protein n=1 Tax=Vanilla planifolia TaxID=51239 RepID=A0A835SC45_VANPL|nr:hypothetical protein HPP92_000969 [Vanilla planifolia]